MPLKDRLFEDLKSAMRQRNELRRSVIRLVRAAIQVEEIAKRKPLDDVGVIDILSRLVRQHHESISEFQRGNRPDLVEREEAELAILRQYMPQQLTVPELTDLARRTISEVSAEGVSDMGRVMSKLIPMVRGRADGATVSQIVVELLGG